MNLTSMLPQGTLDLQSIPDGYMERLVFELAATGCEPVDPQNNLIRLILLLYQADDDSRWAIADRLITLVFNESDEHKQAIAAQVQKLSKEYSTSAKKKGGRRREK